MRNNLLFCSICSLLLSSCTATNEPINSIETPYTILTVRNAEIDGSKIIASGYQGEVLCYNYDGKMQWENKLSGYMNQDIYCADIDGDNKDEILAANSNGVLYCLDDNGSLLWQFSKNDAPMYTITVIHKDSKPYIACGSFDKNLYYIDANGKEISHVVSESYSIESGVGVGGPNKFMHVANLLRTVHDAKGNEVLVMHGTANTMAIQSKGTIYLFKPLADKPYKVIPITANKCYGDISIKRGEAGEADKVLFGSSKDTRGGEFFELDIESGEQKVYKLDELAGGRVGGFGYRVVQPEVVNINGERNYLAIYGSNILLTDDSNSSDKSEILDTKYSYYDITKDKTGTKIILASCQSGGSCIHIIDLNNPEWKLAYKNLVPKGKITSILNNTKEAAAELDNFELPEWENLSVRPKVYFMTEGPNRNPYVKGVADRIGAKYPSPIFLNSASAGGTEDPKSWNRDTLSNKFYKNRYDKRQSYDNTQENILKNVAKSFEGDSKGISMWGGHGNDPFYYQPSTTKKIIELTKPGQQTVLIYPEMVHNGSDVQWLTKNLIYPLADVAREYNSKLFIRSKHLFWLGDTYEPQWEKLVSGEYADVFVPSMEETTDKSMELSLSGRLGIWMSGATDSWGSRCARDNPSYNRLRQHSHQNLPNHFLRNMIYHISYGAQYLDNFAVDQKYMTILWDLIAKGALYVPKRNEIVSFNPVRLSVIHPDASWLDEGNNVKWCNFYQEEKEKENKWVTGHLNGSWPAAPVTEWDFSKYAANAVDRRTNFISSYNNGMVLFAPPYDKNAPRGAFEHYLNPIYKGKTIEFFTDGRYYYSDAHKTKSYSPDEYYKVVAKAIEEGSKMMPLTVKGNVGWVAAQSAPNHIRLTIIDGGYLNPSDKDVVIKIGTAKVKSITDILSGERLNINGNECKTTIKCGLFKFLDIELREELK